MRTHQQPERGAVITTRQEHFSAQHHGFSAEPRLRGRMTNQAFQPTRPFHPRRRFLTGRHAGEKRCHPRRQPNRDPVEGLLTIRASKFQRERAEPTGLRVCALCHERRREPQRTRRARTSARSRGHHKRPRGRFRDRPRPRIKHTRRRIAPTLRRSAQRRSPAAEQFQPQFFKRQLRRVLERRRDLTGRRVEPSFSGKLDEHAGLLVFGDEIQRDQRAERVLPRFPVRSRFSKIHRALEFLGQERRADSHRADLRRFRTRRRQPPAFHRFFAESERRREHLRFRVGFTFGAVEFLEPVETHTFVPVLCLLRTRFESVGRRRIDIHPRGQRHRRVPDIRLRQPSSFQRRALGHPHIDSQACRRARRMLFRDHLDRGLELKFAAFGEAERFSERPGPHIRRRLDKPGLRPRFSFHRRAHRFLDRLGCTVRRQRSTAAFAAGLWRSGTAS